MKTHLLFQSLVAGGALIAGHAVANQSATAVVLDDEQPSALAFCARDNPDTCVIEQDGSAHPREGLVCCWSTSCD